MTHEQEILSDIIQNPKKLDDYLYDHGLKADDFLHPPHEKIMEKIIDLRDATGRVSLEIAIEDAKEIHLCGGEGYIKELSEMYVGSSPDFLVSTIQDRSRLNKAKQFGTKLYNMPNDTDFDLLDKEWTDISTRNEKGTFFSIGELLPDYMEELDEKRKGNKSELKSGFEDLDDILGGLYKSNLIVIGGRPGKGKTSFVLNILNRIADNKECAGFFSVEMSKNEVIGKLLSLQTRIPSQKLRDAKHLSSSDLANMAGGIDRLKDAKLFIDDTPSIGLQEVKSKARRMVKKGAKLIAVDYLQIMGTDRGVPREQQISQLSGGLKQLARDLQVPVIALTQLNRESEKRADGKPKLSDIRESGSVEQDADSVIFLHRPEDDDQAEVIVAKNRHGMTVDLKYNFIGPYGLFESVK